MNSVRNSSINCALLSPSSVSIRFLSISICSNVPSYALFSSSFFVIESSTIALKSSIYEFTSLSSSHKPNFRTPWPNIKLRSDRSWEPTFPTSFYKNTESYIFLRLYSNFNPKNDFTTVLPAILELNSIELIVSGEVLLGSLSISCSDLSTIEMILGTKVSKKEKWKMELMIFLLLAHSLPSAKTTPSPKILILF